MLYAFTVNKILSFIKIVKLVVGGSLTRYTEAVTNTLPAYMLLLSTAKLFHAWQGNPSHPKHSCNPPFSNAGPGSGVLKRQRGWGR